ncbi:hypothetical protein Patl1_34932 [Pistacia atlantica]|uniref:Uncharacterized protein n=1 Tax=Pistacia atlantica TaxID=434234 RepID=A0ACC0ZRH1_9ROSI|nr:hypothetical protein Patl1_34932 [Pistacia atlantica]
MGLDKAYTTVRCQILSVDPLPKLRRAYAIAVQEEKQRAVVTNHTPLIEATALLTKGSESRPKKNGNGDRSQFPPCAQPGKPSNKQIRPQGNNRVDGIASSASSDAALATTMNGIGSPILGLTPTQHQQLLALLGSHVASPGIPSANVAATNFSSKMEDEWVIDTRATNHITYNIDSLSDAINWPDILPVQIPNGEKTAVHALGQIALGKRLTLETYHRGC